LIVVCSSFLANSPRYFINADDDSMASSKLLFSFSASLVFSASYATTRLRSASIDVTFTVNLLISSLNLPSTAGYYLSFPLYDNV
jgi:hypothetical protein